MKLDIPVTGMTCAACAARVKKGLTRAPGVQDAAVNFATERATVEFDPSSVTAAELVAAVERSGYGARIEETTLQVAGLEWAVSGEPLERELRKPVGVLAAEVNIAAGRAFVRYLPDVVTPFDLESAVASAGYELAAPVDAADPEERERVAREAEYRKLRDRFAFSAVVAVLVMLVSMPLMGRDVAHHEPDLFHRLMMPLSRALERVFPWLYALDPQLLAWSLFLLTTPVVFWAGRQFYKGAWSGLLHRSADMNTLIAVGTGAGYLYSVVATAAPGISTGAGLPADVY
jgi:P-type Cu+ transporter